MDSRMLDMYASNKVSNTDPTIYAVCAGHVCLYPSIALLIRTTSPGRPPVEVTMEEVEYLRSCDLVRQG